MSKRRPKQYTWRQFARAVEDMDGLPCSWAAPPFPIVPKAMPFGFWHRCCQPEPPPKHRNSSPTPLWLEWHRVRGIDPSARRSQGRRLSQLLRRRVIARDGLVCGLCGDEVEAADVHIDHIFPVFHGGKDTFDNLQVAHSFCNISKGARILVATIR